MRRTVRFIFLTLLLMLLLSSCVTKRPIGDEQYFQGLGLDGEFVITINAQLLDVDQYIQSDDTAVNYITERMTRLSIALYDSSIYLETNDKKVNAKSIMGMMTLGINAGEEVTVSTDGSDEAQAMDEMENYLKGA